MSTTDLKAFFDDIQSVMDMINAKNMDGALDKTAELMREHPERAEPYHFLGLISFFTRDKGRAVEMIEKAHKIAPHVRDYADALANIYARMGKHAEGLYFAKLVTALEPHEHFSSLVPDEISNYFESLEQATPSYHHTNAMKFFNLHRIEQAANQCEMELRISPDHHAAHDLLGQCYLKMNDPIRARRAFQSAIHFAPRIANYHLHMGRALAILGMSEQAMASFNTALAHTDDERILRSEIIASLPLGQMSLGPYRHEQIDALNALGSDVFQIDRDDMPREDGKICIGYLGGVLDSLADLPFFLPILMNYDHTRFETHVFFSSVNVNPSIRHAQSFVDGWHEVFDVDDDTLSAMISGNGIDILVDLDGVVSNRRTNLLAAKLAPVTIGWPGPRRIDGLPGIAGLNELAPDGPPIVTREAPPIGETPSPLPAQDNGVVTFGAISDPTLLNVDTVKAIADILLEIDNAQLLMAWRGTIPSDTAAHIADMFGDFGVSGRVGFHMHSGDMSRSAFGEDYFQSIDILLDTFPAGALDLASEALWMGIPVVTLGDAKANAGNNAADILRQAGKPEWIAGNKAAYMNVAINLARDIPALANVRSTLQKELAGTPLYTPRTAVAGYENMLTKIMEAKGTI